MAGADAAGLFPDRELFCDFLTAYYTDVEPESALVVEARGEAPSAAPEVVGYLLGCLHPDRYRRFMRRSMPRWGLRVLRDCLSGPATERRASWRFLKWALLRAWREQPASPEPVAHLHFNLLGPYRGLAGGRLLIDRFMERARREAPQLKGVAGQMETFGRRRQEAVFRRLGFSVYDRRPFSKYRWLAPASALARQEVYLTTLFRPWDEGRAPTGAARGPMA